MATKLFVGNLSFNTSEGDVLDLFKQAGNVSSCELIMDKFTNKSRGFAFVEMGTQEEATKAAIADFNGKELDGRALTVNEAKPREDRPRGDFGGGNPPAGYMSCIRGGSCHSRERLDVGIKACPLIS
jgi:cold-inducible RNA-binding protein